MGNLRSFEKLNYSIRPNKNVERKLIAKLMLTIGSTGQFNIRGYRYIGFGSIWFTDFSLFHRALGISDMVSIERVASREQRLRFNRPFECIHLILREYSDAFADLSWEKRSLVWLDSDDVLRPELFADLRRTLFKVQSGSVLFVSVNADSWQLENIRQDQKLLSKSEALRLVVDPANLPPEYEERITRVRFPSLVGDILGNAFKNAVSEARPECSFVPLMNLTYADNVPMTTYGGIVLSESDRSAFNDLPLLDLAYLSGPPQFSLEVPNLTIREKIQFDQLLPRVGIPNSDQLGFELRDKEIEAYVKFYLQYPLYGEFHF